MPETRRVPISYNLPYDIYIGRGPCPRTGKSGEWGNPWSHLPHANALFLPTRLEAVQRYENYLRSRTDLIHRVKTELRGKVLGCWCKPDQLCHGDVLIKIAEEPLL